MALYRRHAHGVWHYEFMVAGKRYRKSTKTTEAKAALAIETQARAELATPPIEPGHSIEKLSPRDAAYRIKAVIRAGRRAWDVAATERNRLPNKDSTPTARRQRWRQIGDALLLGRSMSRDVVAFIAWCMEHRMEIDGPTRAAAMWYAENWEALEAIAGNVSHPLKLRNLATPR